MEKQEIICNLYEEKKHSIRYNGLGNDPAIASVYVMKVAFAGHNAPKQIKITIEEVK